MKRYIDADRLIDYLEKEADKEFKKTEENANSPVLCHFHNGCRMQALDTIDFIKKLQQEQPCEELEKAVISIWKCRADGDASQLVRFSYDEVVALMRTGAEWQEEQMLKDAVEGEICKDYIVTEKPFYFYQSRLIELPDNLKEGDKVKIIIVKEDKE